MPRTLTKVAEPPVRHIRDAEFGKRLEQAADKHPHCPPKHKGRLEWVRAQFADLKEDISNETIRKWFAGETKPRPEKGALLAQIFEVDTAWLQMGLDANISPRERKVRNAMVDGAVNLVAGMIQMDGGFPAFPDEGDKRAQRENVDIYAIIKGAQYSFHVAFGTKEGSRLHFAVPSNHANVIVLGVVSVGSLSYEMFEITGDVIESGHRRGASVEIDVEAKKLRRITGFQNRL